MRLAALAMVAALMIAGCKQQDKVADMSPAPAPKVESGTSTPSAPETTISTTPSQDPVGAEQWLKTRGVPIYHDATIDTSAHSASTAHSANAVFTTSATPKQVQFFYDSIAELKSQTANGSTVFSGKIRDVTMDIEIRPGKGKTEIIVQGRKAE